MNGKVITLDIGTSSCKAILYSDLGEIVATGRENYPLINVGNGWVEQDPDVIFNKVIKAILELSQKAELSNVSAISICAQMSSQLLVDKEGHPETNLISWMDSRAKKEVLEFLNNFTSEEIADMTGLDMVITPAYSIPKLMWLKKHEPEKLRKGCKYIQIKDYVIYKLTGELVSDPTSLKGLINLKNAEPAETILNYIGVESSILPRILQPYEIAGYLQKSELLQWKIPQGIPIVTGWNDMNAAFLGMGALLKDGIGLDMTGTSEHLGWVGKAEDILHIKHEGINAVPFLDGISSFYGVSSSSGLALNWFVKDFLGVENVASYMVSIYEKDEKDIKLLDEIKKLLFLPYLEGERNPWNNPDARGVFFGINKFHTQKHMMTAVMEGICFELRAIYDRLPFKPEQVVVSGGAAGNMVLNQMKADVFGCDILVTDVSEAGCMGAALLAEKALSPERSLYNLSRDRIHVIKEVKPNKERYDYYEEKYHRFLALYKTVCQLF